MAVLDSNPDTDWVYPNIDMFGLEWGSDYGGDYSLLLHTYLNVCEAGSLLRTLTAVAEAEREAGDPSPA